MTTHRTFDDYTNMFPKMFDGKMAYLWVTNFYLVHIIEDFFQHNQKQDFPLIFVKDTYESSYWEE